MDLKICTYNCKNVKSSCEELANCIKEFDIVFLQETWLMENELTFLSKISDEYYAAGITSMDSSNGIVTGRPYGGMGILWRKSIGSHCNIIKYPNETRLMAIEFRARDYKVLFINAYLPYCCDENLTEFQFYLAKLKDIIESYDSPYVVTMGDFNADTNSQQKFGGELTDFCQEEGLILSDVVHIQDHENNYTFVSNHGTTSWLDHILATNSGHAIINNVYIKYNIISSDHYPLVVDFDVSSERANVETCQKSIPRVKWDLVSDDDCQYYKRNTEKALSTIDLDHDLILCDDVKCQNTSHKAAIDRMYKATISSLSESSDFLLRQAKHRDRQLPGWNEYVKHFHQLARDNFLLWRSSGSQRQGHLYQQMRASRSRFKLAIRQCKQDKMRHAADSIAKKLLHKDKVFWRDVKQMQGNITPSTAATVSGVSGSEEICEMWQNHYSNLLNSTKDYSKKHDVLSSLENLSPKDSVDRITSTEIRNAIKLLSKGKACGHDCISGEHLIYCDEKIDCILSILFNAMLVHSHLPDEFMFSLIIPLLKDKKGDITSKDNYRPIAITSIFSKVMELIILTRYNNLLNTAENQFGYKKGLGTDMCIFTFKEIVNYYRSLSSNVYICFMDAAKAFDRVNHWYLFDKLLNRGVPKLIVKLLSVWYCTQSFSVKWSNIISTSFKVQNGVRQGGILSPRLFNVFIDELSDEMNTSGYGCHLNNQSYNHLQYADDSVILAPSPNALQKLVNICENFAQRYDMLYNEKKTFCMCIKSKPNISVKVPDVHLNGRKLKWISEHKYLGVHISEHFKDDSDIKRQLKYIYSKGNMLIRKFRSCSDHVKAQLFKSFCTNLYCSELWQTYKASTYKQLTVAYNNVFRYLYGIKGPHSISQILVNRGVVTFGVLIRKAVFSLVSRISASDNILIRTLYESMYFTYHSGLFKKWQSVLYS